MDTSLCMFSNCIRTAFTLSLLEINHYIVIGYSEGNFSQQRTKVLPLFIEGVPLKEGREFLFLNSQLKKTPPSLRDTSSINRGGALIRRRGALTLNSQLLILN